MSRRLVLGIRKELKNKWERRVPLVPSAIKKLTQEGTKVLVQPSRNRIFPNDAFKQAGAIITDDLSDADVIIGVKEIPMSQLLPNKTYMFFSHTHKGQPYNMPMLQNILDKKITLLDYELLKKDSRRLVQFSRFAGYAGMVDGLHSLGIRLLGLGMASPFLATGMSYMYRNLGDARLDVIRSGMVIRDDGFPKELGPMTFIFTGGGNVTDGALHVFKCLPYEWVSPNDLKSLYESKSYDRHKVYGCQVLPKDYLIKKDGAPFDKDEYFSRPELYKSIFSEKIAPYARFILNGIFWDVNYPRLLSISETRALSESNRLPLLTLSDISCDINGSMEFMSKASTIDDPFYMYDPKTNLVHSDTDGPGIQIMSIDNLPSEMPLEASEYFSESLYPFVSELVKGNYDHSVLQGAIITTANGQLAKQHTKLYGSIKKVMGNSAKKNIAILGSGYVAGPVVDYLLKNPNYNITIASDKLEEAKKLSGGKARVSAKSLDVNNSEQLSALISMHDLIISLIPASLHSIVAERCIEKKKNMVTASYISPSLAALNSRAKDAGIILMNEVGLDPGIDHLTALSIFNKVKSEGGQITEFISWCGGLPAPEASGNPLGYKFSWSPQGVLNAASNSAKYLKDSKTVAVEGSDLLKAAVSVPIMKGFAIEGYPNRDSLKYISLYNLDPSTLKTMFRGTLRYQGFSSLMDGLKEIGLLSHLPLPEGRSSSWIHILGILLKGNVDTKNNQLQLLAKKLKSDEFSPIVIDIWNGLNWMGMFSSNPVSFGKNKTFFDLFCSLLQEKLKYVAGERDLVIMHHIFGIKNKEGNENRLKSTMITYGEPHGYSAMAKTVGLPTAIAAEMILEGQIRETGVIAPMSQDIYEPMLKKLESEGIEFVEKYDNIL